MEEKDIRKLIEQLTLDEKIALTTGADFWSTTAIERLNIPSIRMADGPHGLRNQVEGADHLGVNDSYPATCFPVAAALSCSWDVDLVKDVAIAIAKEAKDQGVSIVLGPGINIKRSPLGGRNFEYFSEDPYLTGELASVYVSGLESTFIMSCLKHYALNNQETNRMFSDSIVDERAMHEIYLYAFKKVIQQANPSTIMASYNKINGVYAGQHPYLISTFLRENLQSKALVISDWGASYDKVQALQVGTGLMMPKHPIGLNKQVKKALRKKQLTIKQLDQEVSRILHVVFKANKAKEKANYNAHHTLAYKAACASIVLLKNKQNILPITLDSPWLIVGELAKKFKIQGSGSSLINPTQYESFIDVCNRNNKQYTYFKGYDLHTQTSSNDLEQAIKQAKVAPFVLAFIGYSEEEESEGFDKNTMQINHSQRLMIDEIAKVNSNIIVIINGGSPIELPFIDHVKAIVYVTLPGQAGASALYDIVVGRHNPSGKLTDTFITSINDCPSINTFAKKTNTALYKESIFVGYRYYHTFNVPVDFPFGHGLSYSDFQYHDCLIQKEDSTITVSFTITNISHLFAHEIAQLYISPVESQLVRPTLELKGFKKIALYPKETKSVTFTLDEESFSYYNPFKQQFETASGKYTIHIGSSSKDIRLSKSIFINNDTIEEPRLFKDNYPMFESAQAIANMSDHDFMKVIQNKLPKEHFDSSDPFTIYSTLTHLSTTLVGKLLLMIVLSQQKKMIPQQDNLQSVEKMIEKGVMESPLLTLSIFSLGKLSINTIKLIVALANLQRLIFKTSHG